MLHVIVRGGPRRLAEVVAEAIAGLGHGLAAERLVELGGVYHRCGGAPGSRPLRVLDPTLLVDSDEYVRVHPNPRRYASSAVEWPSRVQFEDEDLIVLDKPAGIPCCPTVDNIYENVLRSVITSSKLSQGYLPHRLDTDTSGLMIICKNKNACAQVNRLLATRQITKHYRAVLASEEQALQSPLNVGQHIISHMLPSSRSPKIFSKHPYTPPGADKPESVECLSRVVALTEPRHFVTDEWKRLAARNGSETGKLQEAVSAWMGERESRGVTLQQVTLELTTGRTHQARGQLSSIGSGCHSSYHIAGDNIYLGATSVPQEKTDFYRSSPHLALQASFLSIPLRKGDNPLEFRLVETFWGPLVA